MPPHRTHQNGLSVDFMVPVIDKSGASVALPGSPANQFGYGWEFGSDGRAGALSIDFDAMAEHLYRLSIAAKRRNIAIDKVIFDAALMPALLRTNRGPYLRHHLSFMKKRPWIRHDEHYHVDFALPCAPLQVPQTKKIAHASVGYFFFWRRGRESNPSKRLCRPY